MSDFSAEEWKNDPHTLTILERVQMKFDEAGRELADNPSVLQSNERFMYAGIRMVTGEVLGWIREMAQSELRSPGETKAKHSMVVTAHTPDDFEQLLDSLDVP